MTRRRVPGERLKDDHCESLVALGCLGSQFSGWAAQRLLGEYGVWKPVYFDLLVSAFARGDADKVRMLILDWQHQSTRPSAQVSKFIPGEHYYALGQKFDTMQEAIDHLLACGHRYGGLVEKYLPKYQE